MRHVKYILQFIVVFVIEILLSIVFSSILPKPEYWYVMVPLSIVAGLFLVVIFLNWTNRET